MEKLFYSDALIRFSDCDPLGHLNNMRYLDYFLNAREDHLKTFAHFDIYAHSKETGCIWVMFQNKITYLKPVFYNQYVTITSRLMKFSDKSVQVEMQMRGGEKNELKALVWMTAVYINILQNKGTAHPPAVSAMLESLLHPLEENTYDERVRNLQVK